MRVSSEQSGARHPHVRAGDRYVRADVVERVRTFLAMGGAYPRDVTGAIAAAILAETLAR